MSGTSIETTLEPWALSLRDVKARMRPLFTQARVAARSVSTTLIQPGLAFKLGSLALPLAG
jgi:hypothetical protein